MGDTYLYEKIDAEMKTFPWNFPEKYILSEFLPSPATFTGYVNRCFDFSCFTFVLLINNSQLLIDFSHDKLHE